MTNPIELFVGTLTIDLTNFRRQYFCDSVFVREFNGIYYNYYSHSKICPIDELEKVIVKCNTCDSITLEFKSLKLLIFEFVKPNFEPVVKNVLFEKINTLTEYANNLNL